MNWRFIEILAHSPIITLSMIALSLLLILIGWQMHAYQHFSKANVCLGITLLSFTFIYTTIAWTADRHFQLTGDDFETSPVLIVKKYHPVKYSYTDRDYGGAKTLLYELTPGYVRNANVYYTQTKKVKSSVSRKKSVDILVYTPKTKNPILRRFVQDLYQCYGRNQNIDDSAVVVRTTEYTRGD